MAIAVKPAIPTPDELAAALLLRVGDAGRDDDDFDSRLTHLELRLLTLVDKLELLVGEDRLAKRPVLCLVERRS